jgi:hypothetical protein
MFHNINITTSFIVIYFDSLGFHGDVVEDCMFSELGGGRHLVIFSLPSVEHSVFILKVLEFRSWTSALLQMKTLYF